MTARTEKRGARLAFQGTTPRRSGWTGGLGSASASFDRAAGRHPARRGGRREDRAHGEVDAELGLSPSGRKSAEAMRRQMEKEGELEALRARIREEKTLDLLKANARLDLA
jgi:hypothetical protein